MGNMGYRLLTSKAGIFYVYPWLDAQPGHNPAYRVMVLRDSVWRHYVLGRRCLVLFDIVTLSGTSTSYVVQDDMQMFSERNLPGWLRWSMMMDYGLDLRKVDHVWVADAVLRVGASKYEPALDGAEA